MREKEIENGEWRIEKWRKRIADGGSNLQSPIFPSPNLPICPIPNLHLRISQSPNLFNLRISVSESPNSPILSVSQSPQSPNPSQSPQSPNPQSPNLFHPPNLPISQSPSPPISPYSQSLHLQSPNLVSLSISQSPPISPSPNLKSQTSGFRGGKSNRQSRPYFRSQKAALGSGWTWLWKILERCSETHFLLVRWWWLEGAD